MMNGKREHKTGFRRVVKPVLLVMAAVIIQCFSLHAEEKNFVGMATVVKKKVEVKKVNTKEWVALKVGTFMKEGDVVKLGKGAYAEISFITGIVINLKENTEIKIKLLKPEEKGRGTELEIFRGNMLSKVKKLTRMRVITPQAIAAVRGTEFGVDVTDFTYIYVYEGLVDVMNDWGNVELKEGMETVVETGRPPHEPRKIESEEKKEELTQERKNVLSFVAEQEIEAGKPAKAELYVVDSFGKVQEDASCKIRMESDGDVFVSDDSVKWNKLPHTVKLEGGRTGFYIKSDTGGRSIVTCDCEEYDPVTVDLMFIEPYYKSLIIDLDDEGSKRRLKMIFERQE
jgi:hypothetical protein